MLLPVIAAHGGALSVSNWKGFATNPLVDNSGAVLTDADPVVVAIGTFASQPAAPIPGATQSIDSGPYTTLLAGFTAYGSATGLVAADGALERKGTFVFQDHQTVTGTPLAGAAVYVIIAKGADLATASEVAIIKTSATFEATDDASPFPKLVGVGTTLGSVAIVGSNALFSAVPTSLAPTPRPAYSLAEVIAVPEIEVEQPVGNTLTDSVSTVDFNKVATGDHRGLTFTIRNSGSSELNGIAPGVTGPNQVDFAIATAPPAAIPAGGSATFMITFTPSAPGPHAATLSIASNDEDENPFEIALAGTGATATEIYDDALAATAPPLTGPDAQPGANPFDDGIPNLLKYAFNLNLATPDIHPMVPGGTSGLPWNGIVTEGGNTFWQIQHVRRKGSGLIYTGLKSTTLESFAPMTATTEIQDIDAEWERLIINQPYDPLVTPACFGRFKIELPAP